MGPMTVVTPGANIQNPSIGNSIMDSTIPYTKLDTQNIASFQTIALLFNNEPPQPPSSAPFTAQTLVYQFKHGYSYIPSIWLMWQNDSPEFPSAPSSGNSATTFYPFGDDTASFSLVKGDDGDQGTLASTQYNTGTSTVITTAADLCVTVDTSNVNIYILKTTVATVGGNVIPLYLAGVTLNIRCYVFAEPASTSTY